MEKKNFFEESGSLKDQLLKYFGNKAPIRFRKLTSDYNFKIVGIDFEYLKQNEELSNMPELNGAVGVVILGDDIELVYNNNDDIDTYEQRFALANLVAYCERQKWKNEKENVVKNLDNILKCDLKFEGMNKEELGEYLDNQLARQILMPKDTFSNYFIMMSECYGKEEAIARLAIIFAVPIREVAIRCDELGYDIDLEDYINMGLEDGRQYLRK